MRTSTGGKFFAYGDACRLAAMRGWIERADFTAEQKAVLLAALLYAADRCSRTIGHWNSYLKDRKARPFLLELPNLLPRPQAGKCRAYREDAYKAVKREADIVYVDPPYNSTKYVARYHVLETLVLWDNPEVKGKVNKRVDAGEESMTFYSKRTAHEDFQRLLLRSRTAPVAAQPPRSGAPSEGLVKPVKVVKSVKPRKNLMISRT